jgi:hypothetical protein
MNGQDSGVLGDNECFSSKGQVISISHNKGKMSVIATTCI